jgi:hypothetical protein
MADRSEMIQKPTERRRKPSETPTPTRPIRSPSEREALLETYREQVQALVPLALASYRRRQGRKNRRATAEKGSKPRLVN